MTGPRHHLGRVLPLEKLANLAARATALFPGGRPAPPGESVAAPMCQADGRPLVVSGHSQKLESLPNGCLARQLRLIVEIQYEKLIGQVYRNLGYKVTWLTGDKPGCGIDLIAERDGERFAIECKQGRVWTVDAHTLGKIVDAAHRMDIKRTIVIALHGLTDEAAQVAGQHAIHVIEENELISLFKLAGTQRDAQTLPLTDTPAKLCA